MMSKLNNARADVLVVGAGPAGLALACGLVARGIGVVVVDPRLDAPWPNNYGAWVDELPADNARIVLGQQWPTAVVRLAGRVQTTVLERAYARIDNAQTRARHLDALRSGGAALVEGRVVGVRCLEEHFVVALEHGEAFEARQVVDASGVGALVEYASGGAPGFQTAFGMVARFEGDPLAGEAMVLMDYRQSGRNQAEAREVPSFLYGMHLGANLYFVEETVLVARPQVSIELLEARLYRRLEEAGVKVIEVLEVERCRIAMGTALPLRGQSVLAVGAAAGFVHPATGYQFARSMRAAPSIAEAIEEALGSGLDARARAATVWNVIWPAEQVRARALLSVGMEVLLKLDGAKTSRFFEHFFSLELADWSAYLGGEAGHRQIASVMWRLFGQAEMGLRLDLARFALWQGDELWRALAPGQPGGGHG
ncbi:MAG: lycopene cyclase family protein [Bradymonadaceae bacterium]|nr:lycopene cyclase family protein [Lujinxingiaceae bacterium]